MDMPIGSLDDALKGWVSNEATKVRNWKQYHQLQIATLRRWRGEDKARASWDYFGLAQKTQVHRIKIDVVKSLLVMTGQSESGGDGCVVVHCLRDPTREALFRLSRVSDYAHVEMSNGFVVFTCAAVGSDLLELWRWAEDQSIDPVERVPTERQIAMYKDAMQFADFQPGSAYRGELIPIAELRQPAELKALRLVYPTLCVGSRAGDQLWFWDIRAANLSQTIRIEPSPYRAFSMVYVDFDEAHVFVGTQTVSAYSRATGECVFQLPESYLAMISICVVPSIPTQSFASLLRPREHGPEASTFPRFEIPDYLEKSRRPTQSQRPGDIVVAVHVSPSGNDFVATTYGGYIFHISGLKSGGDRESAQNVGHAMLGPNTCSTPFLNSSGPRSLDKFSISVMKAQSGLFNLAYDGHRILAYGEQGLCILHLENQPDYVFRMGVRNAATLKLHPFPSKYVYLAAPFGNQMAAGFAGALGYIQTAGNLIEIEKPLERLILRKQPSTPEGWTWRPLEK